MTWAGHAIKLPFRNSGGGRFLPGLPAKGVLHTTEANTYTPSRSSYYGHRNPPHFTITRDGNVYQHYSTDIAARALKHPRGTVDTNRAKAFQIELVGRARDIQAIPKEQQSALKVTMRWLEHHQGIERACSVEFGGSEHYGPGPHRLTDAEWLAYSGWLGHQHVPNNEHWDPGRIDIADLLETGWMRPNDTILNRRDALRVIRYQGGKFEADRADMIQDDATLIQIARLIDLAIQHDQRLREGRL